MGTELIVRNPAKLQEWAKRIEICKSSGKTVSDWCHQNGINEKTYYYWNRKVMYMAGTADSVSGRFYEIPEVYETAAVRDIVSTVSVGTMKAEIYKGADAETLNALLKAMRQC